LIDLTPTDLTPAMREGLIVLLPGPAVLTGPRGVCPSRWTWKAPGGALIPRQTMGGLASRRLVRVAKDAPAALTIPGRKLAEQLAREAEQFPTRRAS
jgi:hypothetical protein